METPWNDSPTRKACFKVIKSLDRPVIITYLSKKKKKPLSFTILPQDLLLIQTHNIILRMNHIIRLGSQILCDIMSQEEKKKGKKNNNNNNPAQPHHH